MGSITEAVIQHNLSPKEIISLSESLNDFNFIDYKGHKLEWSAPNIDAAFLEKYWGKTWKNFSKEPWGVEDLALLENEKISLHFYKRNLASFDNHLKADVYKRNPDVQSDFDIMAKSIALQMKAIDIVVIEDWYYNHAFDFDDQLTIDIIRQCLKTKNLPFFEIDLNA